MFTKNNDTTVNAPKSKRRIFKYLLLIAAFLLGALMGGIAAYSYFLNQWSGDNDPNSPTRGDRDLTSEQLSDEEISEGTIRYDVTDGDPIDPEDVPRIDEEQ